MQTLIRNHVQGGTYFFTVVTYNRQEFFADDTCAEILLKAIKRVQKRKPFELLAYCILPDHWHILLTLPIDDDQYSQKIREIKRLVTFELRKYFDNSNLVVWQNRFWEHTIRDENDLNNCYNYIMYNPVHHGIVSLPEEWKWSNYGDCYPLDSAILPIIDPVKFKKNKKIFGE